tara:strand:+ start:1347 stop:1598 length:252 start_codon:yes stop_codon:yes gene_type:complete
LAKFFWEGKRGRQKGSNAKDKDPPLFTRLQRSFGAGALQGVDHSVLPDGNDFATSKYERIKATANTGIADSGGRQFLRMTVEK